MSEENRTKKLLEMKEEEKKTFWTPEHKKELREWIVSIGGALLVAFIIRTFLFTMIRVDGGSMLETLQDGDRLFVTRIDVLISGVDRGDIIICHYPDRGRTNFVKRVVGLEGDTVEIKDGVTYVNGEALVEDYIDHPTSVDFGPYTVPEGKIFVMGDNRANSSDSRYVGAIDEDMIVGRARFRWWPFDSAGKL